MTTIEAFKFQHRRMSRPDRNICWYQSCRVARHEEDRQVGTGNKLLEELQLKEAIEALDLLVLQGFFVPRNLLYSVLQRCIAKKDLTQGRRVHALAVKTGYESHTFLANHILRMYASHGKLQEAMLVFTAVDAPDTFMWCSIVSAHAEHGLPKQAIRLYQQMQWPRTTKPNNYVYVAALKACVSAADMESGMQVHADAVWSEVESDVYIGNCLVDLYSKCGSIADSRRVFDNLQSKDVVTWNSMITGYAQHGLGQEALTLYASMQQEGISPADHFTFACLLKACTIVGDLQQGKQLYLQVQERDLEAETVIGNCLVDMFVKCGSLEDACTVFQKLETRDVLSWNSMIAGYVQYGLGQEALTLYSNMRQEGMITADPFTFACLLKACTSIGALHQGKQLHLQIQDRGLEAADVVVGTCLVDMYFKCGSLGDAHRAFTSLHKRDVVTWNAMIDGYGQRNDVQKAMQCFQEMQWHGLEPNKATFSSLLVACSREGLVNEGRRYFKLMVEDYGISPTVELFTCMVDLLGRLGHLDEAENMLLRMPFESNVGWTSLLNACRSYGDMMRGKRCFDSLMRMEPNDASAYVLMENIYADIGKWKDVSRIENFRMSAGVCKKPARAWIEVNSRTHTFVVGEMSDGVAGKLKSVNVCLKEEGGHIPHTESILKPLFVCEEENAICGHGYIHMVF